MLTKIKTDTIEPTTLAAISGPKITTVQVTNNSYVVLDDTAVGLSGGFIKLTGTGFRTGCQIIIGTTPATAVSFVSSTQLHVQVPALTAGTYILYLVNTDGGTTILVNGLTYSATPTWTTNSTLQSQAVGSAVNLQLTATGATTYQLASGSTLPPGLSLSSSGLLSGTVTGITSDTTYNFTVVAIDLELQDSPQAFSVTITAGVPTGQQTFTTIGGTQWTVPTGVTSISAVCVGGGGGGCSSTGGGSGGGGGDLRWMNNISVTPGESLWVFVGGNGAFGGSEGGTAGGESVLARQNVTYIVSAQGGGGGRTAANGGTPGPKTGTSSAIGGNIGGGGGGTAENPTSTSNTGGGGGAGGYNGGTGFDSAGGVGFSGGLNGTGGGGGGGGGAGSNGTGGAGGGVGLLGQGNNGSGGGPGGGTGSPGSTNATGQYYGGGGGGSDTSSFNAQSGQPGAVRIIWGPNRAFPSTNTADMTPV